MLKKGKIYIFNAPVLTDYGVWLFEGPLCIEAVKTILEQGFESAIGHQQTALYLTELLGIPCKMNRRSVTMECGDIAVIFRLIKRQEEGVVLTREQLGEVPYEFAMLRYLEF